LSPTLGPTDSGQQWGASTSSVFFDSLAEASVWMVDRAGTLVQQCEVGLSQPEPVSSLVPILQSLSGATSLSLGASAWLFDCNSGALEASSSALDKATSSATLRRH
jgi:hypothetical protein